MKYSYDSNSLLLALKELDIIPEDKLDSALMDSKKKNIPFEDYLIKGDFIADENLGNVIADILKVPFINLTNISFEDDFLKILPESFARKNGLIVFDEKPKTISIAFSRPFDERIEKFLQQKIGKKITLFYATPRDFDQAISRYERDLQAAFEKEQQLQHSSDSQDDETIIKLVNKMIGYAYNNRASDIHIEPEKDKAIVRLRIDGVLHEILTLKLQFHEQFIARIKYLSNLRTDDHMGAQDGKFRITLPEEDLDIRVSIVPLVHGEKCVMRLLALRYRQFGLTDLGLSSEDFEKVQRVFKKPYGMIISTGPTGSGKTTSMYAILKILNTKERNIATIEDPVEYDIEGINQIQVNPKTNLTFAEGLRSILRQDPNVIYVGEIRDNETADIAINSALTGHLVLSTLHTNDAVTALPRFMEMKIEPYLISSTISLIIAQRLLRKVCEQCRVSYMMEAEELKHVFSAAVIKKFFSKSKKLRFYKGKGCKVCHQTGYSSRIGIFEILEVSPIIQEMIMQKKDIADIKAQAIKEGMSTMLEDGVKKVIEGETTIEELLKATTF